MYIYSFFHKHIITINICFLLCIFFGKWKFVIIHVMKRLAISNYSFENTFLKYLDS